MALVTMTSTLSAESLCASARVQSDRHRSGIALEAKEKEAPVNELEKVSRHELALTPTPGKLLGIPLDVYVRRDGKSKGGEASNHDYVIVVGTVDYRNPSREPRPTPLPPECQQVEPTDEAPAVWLVIAYRRKGNVYLATERPDGGPDLSRQLRWGGSFASTDNPFFWMLLGTEDFSGIRIFDKSQDVLGETRLDIA